MIFQFNLLFVLKKIKIRIGHIFWRTHQWLLEIHAHKILKSYIDPMVLYTFNSKQNFLDSKILYRNASAFEISPEASLDVDTELDFRLVEQIIKSKL